MPLVHFNVTFSLARTAPLEVFMRVPSTGRQQRPDWEQHAISRPLAWLQSTHCSEWKRSGCWVGQGQAISWGKGRRHQGQCCAKLLHGAKFTTGQQRAPAEVHGRLARWQNVQCNQPAPSPCAPGVRKPARPPLLHQPLPESQ